MDGLWLERPEGIDNRVWRILRNDAYMRRYAWLLQHRPGPTHVDVGCGQGYAAALMARKISRLTAVDVDPVCCRIALDMFRLNAVINACVVQADAHKLPFKDRAFASASVAEMLEHVYEPDAVMAEVRRVVEPGGTLLVTVPAKGSMTETVGHVQDFSAEDVTALVLGAGFMVHEIVEEYPHTYVAAR